MGLGKGRGLLPQLVPQYQQCLHHSGEAAAGRDQQQPFAARHGERIDHQGKAAASPPGKMHVAERYGGGLDHSLT